MTKIAVAASSFAGWLLGLAMGAHGQINLDQSIATLEVLNGQTVEVEGSNAYYLTGIAINLSDGWKTYWRSPGEYGLPPSLQIVDGNIGSVEIYYPKPTVFDEDAFRTIGYAGRVVFPLRVTPLEVGGPIDGELQLNLGVCREVCIPASFRFAVASSVDSQPFFGDPYTMDSLPSWGIQYNMNSQPAMAAQSSTEVPSGFGEIQSALNDLPTQIFASNQGARTNCNIEPASPDGNLRITFEFDYDGSVEEGAAAVFESPGNSVWFSESELSSTPEGRLSASAEIHQPEGSAALSRGDLSLTLITEGSYIEFAGCNV